MQAIGLIFCFVSRDKTIRYVCGAKQLPFYLVLNLILREATDFFTVCCCYNKNIRFAEVQQFAIQIYFSQLISYDEQAKLCFVSLSPKRYVFEIPFLKKKNFLTLLKGSKG